MSLNNEVIFQKRDTETINKEFLTEVVEIDSMNERLIPFKSETEFEELTQANKEKPINDLFLLYNRRINRCMSLLLLILDYHYYC